MVLYTGNLTFFVSDDLTDWRKTSTVRRPGGECPDLFELPVDGNPDETLWVLVGAAGMYDLGRFDGRTFRKLAGTYVSDHAGPGLKQFYAT